MKTMLCTDVQRDSKDGKPLYTVKVYDLDTPVNFHSYDCLFHGQGKDLDILIEKGHKTMNNYNTGTPITEKKFEI